MRSVLLMLAGVLVVLVLAGIGLADYLSLVPLGVGLLAGAGVIFAFSDAGQALFEQLGDSLRWYIGLALLVVVGALLAYFAPQPMAIAPCQAGAQKNALALTGYSALITPVDFELGTFSVQEHIVFDRMNMVCRDSGEMNWVAATVVSGVEQDLPARQVTSAARGLLIRELTLRLMDNPDLNLDDCCDFNGLIELRELPYRSFYDAQYAQNLVQDEYLGTETISWQHARLAEGVRFAYIPAPFYNLAGVLAPFIEISKFNGWILSVVGLAASFLFGAIVKPWFVERVKGWLAGGRGPVKKKKK